MIVSVKKNKKLLVLVDKGVVSGNCHPIFCVCYVSKVLT